MSDTPASCRWVERCRAPLVCAVLRGPSCCKPRCTASHVVPAHPQMPPIVRLIERDLSEPYSIFTYRYFINNWPNLCFLVRVVCRGAVADRSLQSVSLSVRVCVFGRGCRTQAMSGEECVGTIVCKLDAHGRERTTHRGYIAMLAVRKDFRKKGIGEAHETKIAIVNSSFGHLIAFCGAAGSSLVVMALNAMREADADEVCARLYSCLLTLLPGHTTLADPAVLLHAQKQCVLETELTNKGALRLYENLGFVRHKRCVRFVPEDIPGRSPYCSSRLTVQSPNVSCITGTGFKSTISTASTRSA
jgi:peptide alpha-N-acetyltransferase